MWVLTLATAAFEGGSYLLAMSAGPILQSVHKSKREIPLTYVFSCVLAWTLIGALGFNIAMVRRKLRFVRLLTIILAGSNFVFYRLAKPRTERSTFWVMCLYGFLLGMYYPCMGTLKARLIEEGIRSTAFSAMRAPVYLFVVAMMLHQSVNGASTSQTFLVSCSLMTAAFAGVWMISLHKKIP
jgi:MFS transporter, MFS domain-containing protein family, molybdate-anion transporter